MCTGFGLSVKEPESSVLMMQPGDFCANPSHWSAQTLSHVRLTLGKNRWDFTFRTRKYSWAKPLELSSQGIKKTPAMTAILSIVAVGVFHPPATGGSREPIGALCNKCILTISNYSILFLYSVSQAVFKLDSNPPIWPSFLWLGPRI